MTKIIYNIENCAEPMRLDRYLRLANPNFTQGFLEKSIRKGDIKLNSKKTKSNIRVINGDIIELHLLYNQPETKEQKIIHPGAEKLSQKLLGEYLIYENSHFLVINKPSGLASQGGSNVTISIDDALFFLNQKLYDNTIENGYRLVHRLDRETSGIFLVAKNRLSATKLTQSFEKKLINKNYLAIIHGAPEKQSGTIANYLTKDVNNQIQKISSRGNYAETEYQILAKNNKFSLVEFRPKTGRMHQIRVHSKFLGCPIVGDEKYGGEYKKTSNLMLHAWKLYIPQEVFDEEFSFESKMPEEFLKFNFEL